MHMKGSITSKCEFEVYRKNTIFSCDPPEAYFSFTINFINISKLNIKWQKEE